MSIGERLRHARLEQGLSLAQLSEQTKVQHWILDALERDDLARVPGGVFIRGYLMSFGRAVGLDGERLWADFRDEMPAPTAEPAAVQPRSVPVIGPWTIVRAAAVVLVLAVVWRNIPRANSDTAPPPPIDARTTDVVLTAATTGIAVPEPVAAPAPAKSAPVVSTRQERKIAAGPPAAVDAKTVDQQPPDAVQAPVQAPEVPAAVGDAAADEAADETVPIQ